MADRRVRAVVGVVPDIQSGQQTKQLLDEVNKELNKLSRSRTLREVAQDAAELVKQGKSSRIAVANLQAELVKVGANRKEVAGVVKEFDRLSASAKRAREEADRANVAFLATAGDPDFGALGGPARGRSNLRSLGRSARVNLPAIPIGGFSSEQIARAVEGIGAAEEAVGGLGTRAKIAAGAIGIAGVAITALFVTLVQEAKRAREEADLALGGAKDYFELINTGTVESIQEQQKANEVRRAIALQNLDFQVQVVRGLEEAVDEMGTAARVTTELGVATGLSAQELAAARDAFNEANKEFQEANIEAANLERALNSDEVQMKSAAKAALELAEARQKEIDSAQRQRLSLRQDLAGEDNLEALDKRIDALKLEREVLADFLEDENLSAELTKELQQEYVNLNREINVLSGSIREEVAARDAARVAAEDQKRTQEEIADATRGFNVALRDLAEDTANKRLQIEEDYADKVTDLTRKYTEDVEDAVTDLQRKQEDIARDVGRDIAQADREARFDRLQEQIEFNQDTAKQSRELERELNRIRDDAANDQLDLIRNRDFAGLERLERERDRALDRAVDDFNVEQREREIAFRQQQELTNQQLEFEAETRRIRFEQQVEDARRAHDRELSDLRLARQRRERLLLDSYTKELTLVSQAERQKLSLLSQAYREELRLAQQSSAVRMQIMQNELAWLNNQARLFGLVSGLSGGSRTSNTFNVPVNNTFQTGSTAAQLGSISGLIAGEITRQLQGFFS